MVNDKSLTRGRLTVKYAAEFEPGAQQVSKLVCAFDLAQTVLRRVTDRLEALAAAGPPLPSKLGEVEFKTLRFHYKCPRLEGDEQQMGRIRETAWQPWDECIRSARATLLAALTGLSGPVVIADAYSTRFAQGVKVNEAMWQDTFKEAPPAKGTLDYTLIEKRANVLAMGAAGSVRARSVTLKRMTAEEVERRRANDLTISFTPEDQGSIHINFPLLLGTEAFRYLHVARTIIHEATHKFADTRDFAYTDDAGYASLSRQQALRNADSHAFAAVSIHKGHFFKSGVSMLEDGRTMNLNI
jgi:Lysine-specific metallo-endopeptidase